MPCETHLLGNLKIAMAVYILPAKGVDSIQSMLSWVSSGRNKMAFESGRLNTSSPSVFSVVEMGSLFQVYAATGFNLPRKFMNTNGCSISFHSSSESQR